MSEQKAILVKRLVKIDKFTISEQGDQFNGVIRLGKNVKRVIGVAVITNNTGNSIRTSKRYWGSIAPGGIINSSDVTAFETAGSSEHITESKALITVTVNATEVFFYAQPTRLPKPQFMINGVAGGVQKVSSLLVTDLVTGYEESYDVYESLTDSLGTDTKIYVF